MKIAEINTSNYGSTGTIMLGIADMLRKRGDEVLVCYPATKRNLAKSVEGSYIIGNRIGRNISLHISKVLGCDDLLYRRATRRLVRRLREFGAEAVHLHVIHGWFLNIPILFNYLKKDDIKVVWTMHDCWAVTGHCPHFDMIGCYKWEGSCSGCPQHKEYPDSIVDNSARMHRIKKACFLGVSDMTIVTPSQWLAGIVRQSFLKDYRTVVINNGIDLSVFKPAESDFRQRYGLGDKRIVLGVAFGWGVKKGLDVFIRLAADLDDSNKVVLVGTDDNIDKTLPSDILSIHRTQNRTELAEIYSAADVFVNPTREEVLGLVNIEALACGTPVITFKSGGSPEVIDDCSGVVVEKDDYSQILRNIDIVCTSGRYASSKCMERASCFSAEAKLGEYGTLFVPKD
jgi:Glycosyltransferase